MNHETAVWTLLACLLAAAVIGFAVAWTLQAWRMREGGRLAADLEAAHHRLLAVHQHLTVSAEHERTARVQADQRSRDLNDQLAAAQQGLGAAAETHQRQQVEWQAQLEQVTEHLISTRAALDAARAAQAAAETARADAETARAHAEAALEQPDAQADKAARAAAEAQAQLAALSGEHAEGQRELLQLRNRLGEASNRTLELEHTINRMQLEALSQAQVHAQALAAAQAASTLPVAADAEDVRIAQRLDAQRAQELEDQLRRSRKLAGDYKLEAGALKTRVADLELRLAQLFAEQRSPADTEETD